VLSKHNDTFSLKKNEILSFAEKWIEVDGIMLSEMSQRMTNTVHSFSQVDTKKGHSEC
jgi:hypothetical protein